MVASAMLFGMLAIVVFRNTPPPVQPTSLFSTPLSSPVPSSAAIPSPTLFTTTTPTTSTVRADLAPTYTLTASQAALITAATSTLAVGRPTLVSLPPTATNAATALPSATPTQIPTESATQTAAVPTTTPSAEPTATLPEPTATASPTTSATSTSTSVPPTPSQIAPRLTGGGVGDLPYDPNGADRDCGDFATHNEAQRFFEAAGGPANDPHRLDGDNDGIACETLP